MLNLQEALLLLLLSHFVAVVVVLIKLLLTSIYILRDQAANSNGYCLIHVEKNALCIDLLLSETVSTLLGDVRNEYEGMS